MGQINKYIVGSICREHVHILIIIMIIIKVITPYTIVFGYVYIIFLCIFEAVFATLNCGIFCFSFLAYLQKVESKEEGMCQKTTRTHAPPSIGFGLPSRSGFPRRNINDEHCFYCSLLRWWWYFFARVFKLP